VRRTKAFYQKALTKLGLKFTSVDTPFFLIEVGDNAGEIQEKLIEEKIFVRKG